MRTLTLIIFLYLPLIGLAQSRKIDIYKETFVKLVIEPKIDYIKSLEDETLGINFNKNSISPNFALLLYKNQNNRFSYQNYVFHWNEIPIYLIEELESIKKKFPTKNLVEKENFLALSNGVSLYFMEYKNKKYLIDIKVYLSSIDNLETNDFGIFLVEGFPLNGKTYQDNEFTILLEKLNEKSKYDFSYSRSYTFSTPYNKIKVENMEIFENYFNSERFKRIQNKEIEFQIVMTKNNISFSNNIAYDGIDPKYVSREAPQANFQTDVENIDASEHLVYRVVDSRAEFPGGEKEFDIFFQKKISNCNIQKEIVVLAKFVVEKDGYITNLNISKENSQDECNHEIYNLIKKMPKWIPAKKDGKIVRSLVEKKIIFNK